MNCRDKPSRHKRARLSRSVGLTWGPWGGPLLRALLERSSRLRGDLWVGMCPCPPSCPHHVSTRVPPSGVNKGRCYCDRERQVSPSGCVFAVPQPPQSQAHGSQLQVRRPRPPSSGNRSEKLLLTPHGKWAPVCSGGARPRGPPSLHAPPPPPTSICGEIARRGPAGSQALRRLCHRDF